MSDTSNEHDSSTLHKLAELYVPPFGKTEPIYDTLNASFEAYGLVSEDERGRKNGIFDRRRSAVPSAHRLSAEIRDLSKDYIDAVVEEADEGELAGIFDEMKTKMRSLIELGLRPGQAEQFMTDAGQEFVEAAFVRIFYGTVVNGTELSVTLPGPAEFFVPVEVWLWGIGDALTELSRIVTKKLCDRRRTRETRIQMRERYVRFLESAYRALERFEHEVPHTIDFLSRRRGGSYRFSLLPRIRRALEDQEERLADMLDQQSK